MALRMLIVSLLLTVLISCATGRDERPPEVTACFGSAPRIDGVLEAGEWEDASAVHLDSTKTLRLKHDNECLYMAMAGYGGTLYIVDGDNLSLLHASFSPGSADRGYTPEIVNIDRSAWQETVIR